MPVDTALILRSVNYRESDRIFTLYTRELGKISAIAKGARKSSKRFGGALQPFAVFETTLNQSRRGSSHMHVLSDAALICDNAGLGKDLLRLGVAGFLMELIREAAPEHEPSATLFDLAVSALKLLSDDLALSPGNLAIAAGLRILAQCGLAMSVTHCTACGTAVPAGKSVYFDALRGGVVCTPCGGGPILLDATAAAAFVYLSTHPIEDGAHCKIDTDTLRKMESTFDTYIHMQLEKQLKTFTYMMQVSGKNQ
ncbi:MAG: DNA repair protein RecO [Deltaproteobacteria bacterium]|nr:DNA repair protein RecO [Deltaproteobacteria bacterium]